MLKKSHRRKRKNRRTGPVRFLAIVLGIFAFSPLWFGGAYAESGVVYKSLQPPKDLKAGKDTPEALPSQVDLKTLPDPFLSYLVREVRDEATLKEQEAQRLRDTEKMLAKEKAAAAEKLRQMREPKTELQKLNLAQLTLTAIIQDGDKSWAMVRDERGMGYILKKGTPIGTMGGRVGEILKAQKKVIVNEPYLEKELYIKYKRQTIELPDEVF
ncbi:MAG: pilus assembly protein PilP [Deltaproteobacteria bacterium]|nr:pilus assembly protein PilP [Deltaproteobacteria bacterium]